MYEGKKDKWLLKSVPYIAMGIHEHVALKKTSSDIVEIWRFKLCFIVGALMYYFLHSHVYRYVYRYTWRFM